MNTNELLHEEGHSTHSLTPLTHSTHSLRVWTPSRRKQKDLWFSKKKKLARLMQKLSSFDSFHRQPAPLKVAAEHWTPAASQWNAKQRPDSGASRLWNFSFGDIINHKQQYLPQSPPIKLFCHSERLGIWARLHRRGLGALRHSETGFGHAEF